MKRNIMKALTLCLALILCLAYPVSASAMELAPVPDYLIDPDADCSLTIFKYDWTSAVKDGVWNVNSFTSTGVKESYVENILGGSGSHNLGNGETSNGYAIKGVGFTYLKVADIVTFTESANDGHPDYNLTQVLYGFNKTASADLLAAIGLADGAGRYENADNTDKLDSANYYYTSNTLNKALADALSANSTTVKDALETYITANSGVEMTLTDANGSTSVSELPVGLYLLVETKVPEMVTSTVNPFFVSLPMTTVTGDENSASQDGGQRWNYDVVVYPKNETGIPTLEKTVRESAADTGKNSGTNGITDGYAHNATASTGDTLEYQIISSLPTITSQATALSVYNFYDSLSEGMEYSKEAGIKLEFFKDKDCTDSAASWDMESGKFTVTYSEDNRHMTVDITQAGLDEINGSASNANGAIYAGYSNYTLRITYTAEVNSDDSFVYGDNGNENEVVLTWKRTSGEYYDTLIDDAHIYSFAIDLTKVFTTEDGTAMDSAQAAEDGLFEDVTFTVRNETDGYWLVAQLDEENGIYYVTGHTDNEKSATVFTPVTSGSDHGKLIIKGCEDDAYMIEETATASGYTLLKDAIELEIAAIEDTGRSCDIYSKDVLGVLQNDPYYSYNNGDEDLTLANIPQKQLSHNYMTANAKVDGNAISMTADNGSNNAKAPLTIVNARGFDLPQTGDTGTWLYSVIGIVLMAGAAAAIVIVSKKKSA